MCKRLLGLGHASLNYISRKSALDEYHAAIGGIADAFATMSHAVNSELQAISCFKQALLFRTIFCAHRSSSLFAVCVVSILLASSNWRSEEHTSELQSRFDLVCL